MLIGQFTTSLGEKNRIAVPKKLRNELGNKLVVARWYEKCLVLVSLTEWVQLTNRLTGTTVSITAPVRDTDRFVLGSAFEVETDGQGRFVIPQLLKDYAGITQDIVFLGLGNRVEVWDKQEWVKREEYIAVHAADLLEEIERKSNA